MKNESVSMCNELCNEYANLPKKERVHTEQMIFPRAALYMQMTKHIAKERAIDLLMKAIRIGVEPDIKRLRWLTKPVFMRSLFLKAFYKILSISFNEEAGFQTKFQEASNKRLRVDVLQCPYYKYCSLLDCKELTATFCYSDDCIYSNLTGIDYRRNGTIGRGATLSGNKDNGFYVENSVYDVGYLMRSVIPPNYKFLFVELFFNT